MPESLQHHYPRPMSVADANVLREIELWREHQRVGNELRQVQRRAHLGLSTVGDDQRHRDLMNELEVIETAIVACECEQGAEMSAELQRLADDWRRMIDTHAVARLNRAITDALSAGYQAQVRGSAA